MTQGAYPRSRGGTGTIVAVGRHGGGLSPLARGNPIQQHRHIGVLGPIPARAGEPKSWRRMEPAPWAYPRSRGGTSNNF